MSLKIARLSTTDKHQRKGRNADIRCDLFRGLLCGLSGLVQLRLLLMQHSFQHAALVSLCRIGCRLTGRSEAQNLTEPRPCFRRRKIGPSGHRKSLSQRASYRRPPLLTIATLECVSEQIHLPSPDSICRAFRGSLGGALVENPRCAGLADVIVGGSDGIADCVSFREMDMIFADGIDDMQPAQRVA